MLWFADDIALLAPIKEELEKPLHEIEHFFKKINMKKSEVLVRDRKERKDKARINIGDENETKVPLPR